MSLPSRSTNSWIAAWLSWRAIPMRSSSVFANASIFWLSIVRSMARILSRRPAARSYSVRSAAARHLGPERLHQRLLATFEEQLHLGDVLGVVGLRDGLDARALAALDVIQEARPLERPDAVLDLDRAGPEREEPADQVHRLVDARGGRVRPEVAAPVVDELARPLDAREVVAVGDLDVRVALVVLEPDVEPRPEALDEVGLEEQRLGDRVGQGDLDVHDPVDDAPDPVDLAARRLLLPVAPDAVAQALRLADVQHGPARVLHEVHAGPVGQVLEGRGERSPGSSGSRSDARSCHGIGRAGPGGPALARLDQA